jgi:hypothetical protein
LNFLEREANLLEAEVLERKEKLRQFSHTSQVSQLANIKENLKDLFQSQEQKETAFLIEKQKLEENL